MRDYKFRGKRIDNGEWVHGCLNQFIGKCFIQIMAWYRQDENCSIDTIQVITETVGQFTGWLDRRGKNIWDGDILLIDSDDNYYQFFVKWDEEFPCYILSDKDGNERFALGELAKEDIEVIGNIHENPDLLEATNGQQ